MSTPPPGPAAPPATIVGDRACAKCSYNLRGLSADANCPECGTPIQGILLRNASPDYLATVRLGLTLILNGTLLSIAVTIVLFFSAYLVGSYGLSRIWLVFMHLVSLGITAMILLGYWRYTAEDLGYIGSESPDSPRKIIRIAIVAQFIFQAVSIILFIFGITGSFSTVANASPIVVGLEALAILVSLAAFAAWVVQFFAVMQYTRWMARRIPDNFVEQRAGVYMWLLPLFQTVGIVLLFLGPLIALILYWNLLDRVRKQLRSIADTGLPADLPGRLG
jgi:hypothetical protein